MDYSAANTVLAQGAVQAAGLADRARFTTGDAERLPYPDAVLDAVVCEGVLCTFPDKTRAAAEFARALKPGGRLGITNVTIDPARLQPELTGLGARIACIADARPLDEYAQIRDLRRQSGARLDHAVRRPERACSVPSDVCMVSFSTGYFTTPASTSAGTSSPAKVILLSST